MFKHQFINIWFDADGGNTKGTFSRCSSKTILFRALHMGRISAGKYKYYPHIQIVKFSFNYFGCIAHDLGECCRSIARTSLVAGSQLVPIVDRYRPALCLIIYAWKRPFDAPRSINHDKRRDSPGSMRNCYVLATVYGAGRYNKTTRAIRLKGVESDTKSFVALSFVSLNCRCSTCGGLLNNYESQNSWQFSFHADGWTILR